MNDTIEDQKDEAVDAERERCALLAEQLAAIHQKTADRWRAEGTYTTRAIWPPFKKLTLVTPAAERGAKQIEACVRSLRVIAGCIRLRYDPLNMLKPDDVARIKDYVSPISALNPPRIPYGEIPWRPCPRCTDQMDCGSWACCLKDHPNA